MRPGKEPEAPTAPSLADFVEGQFSQWATANRKTGAEQVARLKACFFAEFGDTPLDRLSVWDLEMWRNGRLAQGRTVTTVNRDLMGLKAALSRAVDWELIEQHPLAKIKPGKVDDAGIVRYLSPDEEQRLRATLTARDADLRAGRDRANTWREQRHKHTRPELGTGSGLRAATVCPNAFQIRSSRAKKSEASSRPAMTAAGNLPGHAPGCAWPPFVRAGTVTAG